MRRVEAEALVGASRREVWDLYDDIAGTPRWVPFVERVLYVSGPATAGTVYREQTRVGPIRSVAQWEIVEHDRRRGRQVHVSRAAGLESRLTITLEPRGTGTRVHQAKELRSDLPQPARWLHELAVGMFAAWGVRAAVGGAKRAFEGDGPR
jgi:uncharacterized protein YndB with AHSA1/START domain